PVGAGIGDDPYLDRRQRPVLLGAELDVGRHLVTRARADELLLSGALPHHGPAKLQGGKDAEILGEHLLLAAEPAPDALGEHVDIVRKEAEQIAELLPGDERRLRAGADVKPPVVAFPG